MRDFHKIARKLTESVCNAERNTLGYENEPDCEFSWREGPRPAQFFDIRNIYGGTNMNRLGAIADKVAAGGLGPYGIKSLHYDITGIYNEFESGRETEAGAMERALRACAMFVKDNKAKPKATATKWGFDLTDFGNTPARFQRVLAVAGISPNAEPDRGSMQEFIWKGSGIIIVTGNNPITGEYFQPNRRAPEVGYASYIGIEGNPDKVLEVAKAVKKNATNIKDESKGERDFI